MTRRRMTRQRTAGSPIAGLIATSSAPAAARSWPTRPPVAAPSRAAPTARPVPRDPQPIVLPRDDAPHDRLTEWWYYTGHLRDGAGRRYGFEFVVFRAERGAFPVTWASHLAITDETGRRVPLRPAQRDRRRRSTSPRRCRAARTASPWPVSGVAAGAARRPIAVGHARLGGAGSAHRPAESGGGDDGRVAGRPRARSPARPPRSRRSSTTTTAGSTSGRPAARTTTHAARWRPPARSTLDGRALDVTGTAWFDHQWGDFISVGGGGWDWFAVELDDGTDLMLSLVRSADGAYPLVYGTLVDRSGAARPLVGPRSG